VVRAREEEQRYRVEATGCGHETFTVAGAHRDAFSVGEHCLLAARPENFAFGTADPNVTNAKVGSVIYRGSITMVELEGGCGENLALVARAGEKLPERGSLASISWRPEGCFLLKQE
jgi:ABC-type Fe3+/spermidine/putrescine transport system ATPase subunit